MRMYRSLVRRYPAILGGPIVSAQQRGEDVPLPPIGTQAAPPDPRAQAEEVARQRADQERDAARISNVFLGSSSAIAGAEPAPSLSLNDSTPPPQAATSGSQQDTKRGFLERTPGRLTVSAERVSAPASPNIIQAGSVIPAALITGIRSDLPGQIVAQVTANVYDSPTGRILLIPQGARLIGEI